MKFLKPKFWDKKQISLFSILLFPIALFIKLLNFFKRFFTKNYRCSIPVICVGNIYLGGTGKTPLCIELFSILKNLNKNPVFIRKKYESFQDEINLLKQIGPTYEGSKRINAINDAIQSKADVVILDDGFQDFSINKNLSIVCFNEKQWIGNGLVIPSGPLREELSALNRANCVIINNREVQYEMRDRGNSEELRAIKYETVTAIRAPRNAAKGNMFMLYRFTLFSLTNMIVAPSPAPDATPIKYGSANGFLNIP